MTESDHNRSVIWKDAEEGAPRPWWSSSIAQIGPIVVGFFVLLGILAGFVPSPLTRDKDCPSRPEVETMINRSTTLLSTNYEKDRGLLIETLGSLRQEVHELGERTQAMALEQERLNGKVETLRAEVKRR